MVKAKNLVWENNRLLNTIFSKWQLYLLLFIPLAYLIIFHYVPMIGVIIAFKDFNARDGILGSQFVGLINFKKFFNSYQFERTLKNTLIVSFYQLTAGFPIPIVLALMVNAVRSVYFRKSIQMVTYIPHFISIVVLTGMILQLLNPRVGLYGTIYKHVFNHYPADIFANPGSFVHIYVWSGIWQNAGWASIIYMASLSAVDSELHEAATIDGANRLMRILKIDLPCILPTATILLILNAGQIMNVGFEKVFLLQNPLNLRASEVISTYVYKVGLAVGMPDFSYATAIGLFNSIVNMILIVIVNSIAKKLGETSLW